MAIQAGSWQWPLNVYPRKRFSLTINNYQMQLLRHIFYAVLLLNLLTGCRKTDIAFEDENNGSDPSITYYDNYPVSLSTYKIDSFITSGHSAWSIGYHRDSWFGNTEGAGYTELLLPDDNPLKGQSVLYDSLVLVLTPTKGYYGDTALPVHFTVNELTENIRNDDEDSRYYNARKFSYNPIPAGTRTVSVRPGRDTAITIRLNDALGQDLFQKLKNNAPEIQSQSAFISYIKGFRIGVDTSLTNNLYYFSIPSDSMVLRMDYRINGTTYQEKKLKFKINSARQFNYLYTDRQYSPLSVFTAFKKQLKSSDLTAHKAFLHSNLGSMIRISIPDLLSLKELHPYVKMLKALLILRPAPGTYSYPYSLPPALSLYSTDESNALLSQLTDATGQSALTGSLVTDNLYGEQTYYSFDITSFISSIIAEGEFSKTALMLTASAGTTETSLERLVINDQTLSKGIQLKLYILGL